MVLEIKIKGKPTSQKRHRHTKKGFTYDPSKSEKGDFIVLLHEYAPKQPLRGEIILQAYFYLPRPKKHFRTGQYSGVLKEGIPLYCKTRPDLDNYLKFVMDCCNGVIWVDDSQVVRVMMSKSYSLEPRTELIIEEKK
tara:strand:+ start:328 stop:738 length:411 start_codon:yes stop_codon:yes gene_type:complete